MAGGPAARWLTALRRIAVAVAVVWVVVSFVWASVALTSDPNKAVDRRAINLDDSLSEEEKEAALERLEGEDRPAVDRYLEWAGDFATLDWGAAESMRRYSPDNEPMPVTAVLAMAIPNTLRYVVPAVVLAVGLGVATGTYAALRPESGPARLVSVAAYVGSGFPNFYLAVFVPIALAIPLDLLGSGLPDSVGPFGVRRTIMPVFVLTLGLLGSQIRYARTEAMEYVTEDFVRLVRAKGAGPVRVARHVLRTAAVPLVTLFFTEVLAVLVVDVFVLEYVFPVRGIGNVAYVAIFARDVPLVVGVTAVVVAAGVLGTLLQDLAYVSLDPRADE